MIKEDLNGGFGKQNEQTAIDWCRKNVAKHDSSVTLAEECASVFDFYLEAQEGKIPEKLLAIAESVLQEDIGEGFGRYMSGILKEENGRRRKATASVEHESAGQRRAKLIQELPQNRIRFRG
jgi:hypothetical protein